jgi:hypothetical protein
MNTRRLLLLLLPLCLSVLAARSRPARVDTSVPTFNKHVVRIFQQNCQTCHHPGDIAPFSLMTYQETRPYAHLIKFMTQTRQMPPWKAAEGCGNFEGVRRLTQGEIDTIARWVDAGAPEGNPTDLPAPLEFQDGWAMGEPDLVLTMPQPYTPPARAEMYRCFPIPTANNERRWVRMIDVRPGDRATVHHVIAFLDTNNDSSALDAADPEPGYQCFGGPGFFTTGTLGGWAPGTRPMALPDGVGLSLPANARVVLQVHYHGHGEEVKADQTQIGVYYADKPVAKELRILPLVNNTFTIPAGESNYRVDARFTNFLASAHALLVYPHMHLLGKRMKVEAHLPDGRSECLIDIQDWDFNWQGGYFFKDPVPIPLFTRLEMSAWFDNSADNPRNPNNPPKPVSWGEATTDEMALAFIGFTIDSENLLP